MTIQEQQLVSRIPKPIEGVTGLTQRVTNFVTRIPSRSNSRRRLQTQETGSKQPTHSSTSTDESRSLNTNHPPTPQQEEANIKEEQDAASLKEETGYKSDTDTLHEMAAPPNWRVVDSHECNEVAFSFPKLATKDVLPRKIVITTNVDKSERDVKDVCPLERATSPEMISQMIQPKDSGWLTECTSQALNELLKSLKIDPYLLRTEPCTANLDEMSQEMGDVSHAHRSGRSNEGKLAVHSHPISI